MAIWQQVLKVHVAGELVKEVSRMAWGRGVCDENHVPAKDTVHGNAIWDRAIRFGQGDPPFA